MRLEVRASRRRWEDPGSWQAGAGGEGEVREGAEPQDSVLWRSPRFILP